MAEQTRPVAPKDTLAVVLAAGEGTRMKSLRPKVLHEIAGRSMLAHVLAAVEAAGIGRVAVVIGPHRDDVAREVARLCPGASVHVQTDRLGTAHAVLHARPDIAAGVQRLVVLFADTPLVRPETIATLASAASGGHAVAVLGFRAADPAGYGRLLVADGRLTAIREHKDATEAERRVTLCNAGLMAFEGSLALEIIDGIGNDNAQKEFYLTDAVEAARALRLSSAVVEAGEAEVMGVNDRVQLAAAEALFQTRLRDQVMRAGATLVDPPSVFLSYDTVVGRDVVIEPNVVIGRGVSIGDGAVVHAHSHLEGASIGPNVSVGPFARLRPGARLGAGAKVGNFVEIKAAEIGDGAKVSHLSYIGDASVGAGANVGAGTITCNYDGFFKYRTEIGRGAFIGSNSALVAPVRIGDGAYVGSGSVVTKDVPDDALAVARGRQTVKPGWAASFRQAALARKSDQGNA